MKIQSSRSDTLVILSYLWTGSFQIHFLAKYNRLITLLSVYFFLPVHDIKFLFLTSTEISYFVSWFRLLKGKREVILEIMKLSTKSALLLSISCNVMFDYVISCSFEHQLMNYQLWKIKRYSLRAICTNCLFTLIFYIIRTRLTLIFH